MDQHFFIPIAIVAVVFGTVTRVVRIWTQHLQEQSRIRLSASQQNQWPNADSSALEALRKEIMSLRDTTTQYDISVERTLAEIRNRLAHLEGQHAQQASPGAPQTRLGSAPEFQQVGTLNREQG